MHLSQPVHRTTLIALAAIVGSIAVLLAAPATGLATNANQYACLGHIKAGEPEAGNEEQQVQYSFYCNGPITGYQLEAQIPLTGIGGTPLLAVNSTGKPSTDTFSCMGEVPGLALNCVGLAKAGWETITGQFSIATKLCAEPRVDPLLTVTYASVEKGVVTQAISGPFDIGRPAGCPADAYSGSTRLNPRVPSKKSKKSAGKKPAKKGKSQARRAAHKR